MDFGPLMLQNQLCLNVLQETNKRFNVFKHLMSNKKHCFLAVA